MKSNNAHITTLSFLKDKSYPSSLKFLRQESIIPTFSNSFQRMLDFIGRIRRCDFLSSYGEEVPTDPGYNHCYKPVFLSVRLLTTARD